MTDVFRESEGDAGIPAPLVSVVIPVYKDWGSIGRCVDGLGSQDPGTAGIEVIVVDNGGEGGTREWQARPGNVRVIECRRIGSYAARNAGILEARGEVLAFTDADCVPEPGWLRHGVEAVLAPGGSGVVGGEVRVVASASGSAIELYQCMTGFMQRRNIEHRGFSVTANLFVKRAIFDQVGLFDERLLSGGDREWCWRAEKQGYRVGFEPRAVVATRARRTLIGAAYQVRRTTGGRFMLREHPTVRGIGERLESHRSKRESFWWILRYPGLRVTCRLRVLCIAVLLNLVRTAETARLWMGGRPLRR